MKIYLRRIKRILVSERNSLAIFSCLCLITLAFLAIPLKSFSIPIFTPGSTTTTPVSVHSDDLKLTATISQTKVVQNSEGVLYLKINVETPESNTTHTNNNPVDMVVVLDPSGSMSAANKLPYARQALAELASKLDHKDRLALITFDDRAVLNFGLSTMSNQTKERFVSIAQNIRTGGSTNISDGLYMARNLLRENSSHREKRILLLSDGEANRGVKDHNGLSSIVSRISSDQAVVSTIGMGLGFNETLMASLADHGMGTYSYLFNLSELSRILDNNLLDTRTTFASSSKLELKLANGVELVDASGFPIERNGRTTLIGTGRLSSGQKTLHLTLKVPTTEVNELGIGELKLNYIQDSIQKQIDLPKNTLMVSVVEEKRRNEAIATIDQKIFKESWSANNFGKMQAEYSRAVKSGKRKDAEEAISNYRKQVKKAEEDSNISLDGLVAAPLKSMERKVDEAFTGAPSIQRARQNRLAKDTLYESRSSRR